MIVRECRICQQEFYPSPKQIRDGFGKFCSRKCSGISFRGKQEWRNTKGLKKGWGWNKGKPNTWYNPKGLEVGRGLFKGKHIPQISGEKHWNWQGGITNERDRRTKLLEYKLWRKAIYERDSYTCVECGDKTSGNLTADHIKPWSLFPDLRYKIDNGQTLCKKCHTKKGKLDFQAYFRKIKLDESKLGRNSVSNSCRDRSIIVRSCGNV